MTPHELQQLSQFLQNARGGRMGAVQGGNATAGAFALRPGNGLGEQQLSEQTAQLVREAIRERLADHTAKSWRKRSAKPWCSSRAVPPKRAVARRACIDACAELGTAGGRYGAPGVVSRRTVLGVRWSSKRRTSHGSKSGTGAAG